MKKNPVTRFFSTTIIGGLIFLVPLGFLVFILAKVLTFMKVIADPLARWIALDTIGGIALANLLALAALIVVSFLAGLIARHSLAKRLMKMLESKVLINLPGYAMVKGIKNGFDEEEAEKMKPVVLQLGAVERIGLEMEKLPDGRSMVYIPSAPSTWSGVTQIMPAEDVTYLDVPVTKVVEVTEKYGHGVEELLRARISQTA